MHRHRPIVGILIAVAFGVGLSAPSQAIASPQRSRASREATELSARVPKLFVLTKSDTRGVVTVPRHDDNRVLRVILESDSYYSSKDIQLDGGNAALIYTIEWKSVPPGSYTVTVEVYGSMGLRDSLRKAAPEAPTYSAER